MLRSLATFAAAALLLATAPSALSADEPAAVAGAAQSSTAKVKKVLIIGIDGCRTDALEIAKTPALDKLRDGGAYSTQTSILGDRPHPADTVSGPGWSNILCGVWPDKHGVQSNTFIGSQYEAFPHFFARLKAAKPGSVTISLEDWGEIAKRIVSAADVSEAFKTKGKVYVDSDEAVAAAAKTMLAERDPTAMFVYFGQVDEHGHRFGFHPKVPEYIAALERVDALVGKVIAAVEARPTFAREDWLVIVCTDHGGQGLNHSRGHKDAEVNNVFLIVSGPSAARGVWEGPTAQVDVVATALAHLEVELKAEWKLDGKAVGLKSARRTAETSE